MARITVPDGQDPKVYTWSLAGEMGKKAEEFSDSMHASLALPVREFEAARIRIAQINECQVCLSYRAVRDNPALAGTPTASIPDDFYESIREWRSANLTARGTARGRVRQPLRNRPHELRDRRSAVA